MKRLIEGDVFYLEGDPESPLVRGLGAIIPHAPDRVLTGVRG